MKGFLAHGVTPPDQIEVDLLRSQAIYLLLMEKGILTEDEIEKAMVGIGRFFESTKGWIMDYVEMTEEEAQRFNNKVVAALKSQS